MTTDYTSRDFISMKNDLIKRLQIIAPELTNKNESEFAIVMIDLFCYVGDLLSYSIDMKNIETYLATARQRQNVIKICKSLNYKLSNSKPATVNLMFYINEVLDKDIIIPAKTVVYTNGDNIIYFETDEICIIKAGQVNASVTATQGLTKYETLGYSNGEENQTFEITSLNILDGIEIYSGDKQYFEVSNFIGSNSDDVHFVAESLSENVMQIKFGNGLNGKIPNVNNRIFSIYRVGDGKNGNVGANTIRNIQGQIFDSDNNPVNVLVDNITESVGGEDIESIESAKIHAPAQQYTLWRAVTEDDFKYLALTQKDVIQANTILDEINEIINVYIRLRDFDNIPADRLAELNEFFNERKLIGVDFAIYPPEFVTINLSLDVKIFSNYYNFVVEANVLSILNTSEEINNLDFGESPISGAIIKNVMGLDGVKDVDITIDNTTILPNQIAKINVLSINVFGGM